MNSEKKKLAWVSDLRVCAMFMIVACHIAPQLGTALGTALGQFLNVGVEIFFLISGYLFGCKKIQNRRAWLWKRLTRLAPAYYLYLLLLVCIHTILGIHQSAKNWLISVLFLEGTEIYLIGAEHLWFLTVMIACYLITPILDLVKRKDSKLLVRLLIVSAILQVIATIFISSQLGRYWHLVNLYIVAYILGNLNISCKTRQSFITGVGFGLLAIMIRLLGRHYFDGTIFYQIYIVGLTHAVLAISIMMGFQYLVHKEPGKPIKFFDEVSYEMYIAHYMFISGPVRLMGLTNSFVFNCIIACLCSVGLATALHCGAQIIINKLGR